MIDIDDVIHKIENEYDKQYYIAVGYKDRIYYHSYLEDAAEYLKILKQIMKIAGKDDGKSATKSFEYMQQIKKILEKGNENK